MSEMGALVRDFDWRGTPLGDPASWPQSLRTTVRIRVTDTGVGVAPDKHAAIFDPFVQAHRRLTRMNEGTGLGLAISRDLARGMGGDLTVDSVEGHGATFTLTLPAAR